MYDLPTNFHPDELFPKWFWTNADVHGHVVDGDEWQEG